MATGGITESTRTYKRVGEVTLLAHVFSPDSPAVAPRAAIVFFFGGGWTGGTPTQFFPQCRHLALRGMVAVSAEYRVRDRHGTTPVECVADGKSAVRWLRANATDLGIDPSRIAAGGGSAGGHVAACAALVPGFEEPSEDPTISSAPDALVLYNPVVDATWGTLSRRFGDRVQALSPRHHIRANAPPTLIFHGIDDRTVPYAQVADFGASMRAAGNACEVVGFDGQTHGFFNEGRGNGFGYAETLRQTDAFLTSLGYLAQYES